MKAKFVFEGIGMLSGKPRKDLPAQTTLFFDIYEAAKNLKNFKVDEDGITRTANREPIFRLLGPDGYNFIIYQPKFEENNPKSSFADYVNVLVRKHYPNNYIKSYNIIKKIYTRSVDYFLQSLSQYGNVNESLNLLKPKDQSEII